MDENWKRIFGAGALAVAFLIAFVLFIKRGDHPEPKVSVLKERTIALDETTSLLLLDVRIVNDSNFTLTVNKIEMSVDLPQNQASTGVVLHKRDLAGTFQYFPVLGEKYNETLGYEDQIKPRSTADRMLAASFPIPLPDLDRREKINLKITDLNRAAAEFSGK